MVLNFQQKGSEFLRRVLVIALLVVSVVCVTLYAHEGEDGPLHGLQNGVSAAFTPLKFLGAATNAATDVVGEGIGNITADESTLSGLREYNAELIEQYSKMEEYRQENERLRALLDFTDASDVHGIGARVIGRSAQAWSQTITIDKGEADGVDAGLTVMAASGVIGQVVGTTGHTATVRLLVDPKSGAAALVQSSRAEGIVRGSLEGLLYLENLDVNAVVNPGDVVITSGLGGSYVKGLVIGTVVKIDLRAGDAIRRAVVAPNDQVSSLEEVFVIFSTISGDSPKNAGKAPDKDDDKTSGEAAGKPAGKDAGKPAVNDAGKITDKDKATGKDASQGRGES